MSDMQSLYDKLIQIPIPFAYNNFPKDKVPPMPYGVFLTQRANPFYADGRVYFIFGHLQVELYTKRKRIDLERKIEQALDGFAWAKDEEYLSDEKCYVITYELEVRDDGDGQQS